MLFAHPMALWLLLLAIPLVALHLRGGRTTATARWVAVTCLRTLAFVSLVLALARPLLDRPDARRTIVAVMDASASVGESALAGATATARALRDDQGPDEDFAVVVFDRETRAELSSVLDEPNGIRVAVPDEPGSALADALRLAGGLIPHDGRGRVVVYSDGLETGGDAEAEAWKLAQRGIPVETMACEIAAKREVVLVSAMLPPSVGAGATATLEAIVDATSSGPAELVVNSRVDGTQIRTAIELTAGRQTITQSCPMTQEGLATYTVRIDAEGDGSADNNELPAAVFVERPLRLAVVEDADGSPAASALSAWLGPAAVVQDVVPSALTDPESLDGIDVLALADVPADALPAESQQHIVRAVTDGLGLLVGGGRRSFGPGGYARTPLADVLPVRFSQEVQRRDPSTTLVIIIDTSGSMGGSRVNQAKEIARLAIARLKPHDKVGIVEFYGSKRWAAPIQPASNAIDLQRALNRLSSGGGTVILPAIEEAYYALQNVQTRTRHVLVLTDGGVEPGAFEPLIRRMSDRGITLSTVMVGPGGHSAFLASLAQWGRGRFYAAPDRFNMPEIIVKQPESSLLSPFIEQPAGLAVRSRHPIVNDADLADAPELAGYVETQARPTADVLIESSLGHPVLAMWHYGLGTVAACATHIGGEWSRDLSDWPGYGTMMCRLVRTLARPAPERALRITPIHRPGAVELEIKDTRPSAAEGLVAVEMTLADASGPLQTQVLDPIAPNRWNTRLAAAAPGTYTVSARTADGERGGRAALVVPPVREVTSARADGDRLAAIAGWSDRAEQRAAELAAQDVPKVVELQPALCLAVVLLVLVNVLIRRWPERRVRRFGAAAATLCLILPVSAPAEETAEPAIVQAQSMLDTGDLAEARDVLRSAAESRPESAALWAELGRVEELIGDAAAALASLERAESREADPVRRLAIRVRAALIAYDRRETAAAAENLREAAADIPSAAGLCAHVAGLSGDEETALDLLPMDGSDRSRFHAHVFRGLFLLRLDRPTEAQQDFEHAYACAPLVRDRRYALERIVAAARKSGRLAALVDSWLHGGEPTVEQLDAIAPVLQELGRADEALRLLQRDDWSAEHREHVESPEFQRSIIATAVEAGRTREAMAAYRALVDREPRQVEWRTGLGRLLLLEGRSEEAMQVFVEGVARFDHSQDLMALAEGARRLGLDEAALSAARKAGVGGNAAGVQAVLFEVDLMRERGQTDAAMQRLRKLVREVSDDAGVLLPVAEAFERYGDNQEALRLFRRIYEATESEDILLRVAWLLEQNDRFDEALTLWKQMWETTQVPARRRQAQERVLDLASRGGHLADLAIELEERLAAAPAGTAPDDRALSLLVDIYTTANDAVSAAEILQEFTPRAEMTGESVDLLKRLARVYLSCEQFGRCSRVLRRLTELDPANAEEYLQQIAVVALERRQPHEARAALAELEKHAEDPAVADEFSAGVLDMLGLHDEAAAAYARLLDRHPDRIEAHLMWGNAMKSAGRTDQAIARFQALVEEASEDDLFAVAVDGLLNLEAPPAALQSAYRRVVSRIAARPDQVFLYRLAADLQDAVNHTVERDRVLEQSVVVAGERRAPLLRELMDAAGVNNQTERMIEFGRSILALDQEMPPQVYLDLGEALIKADRPAEAERVFARARVGADFSAIQQKVATYFENANRPTDADRIIRDLLVAQPDNVPLLIRSGGLCEQLAAYDRAFEQYGRAADLMLRRLPRTVRREATQPAKETTEETFGRRRWRAANLDEISQYFASAGGGLVNAARSPALREKLLADLTALLNEELESLETDRAFAATLDGNLRLSRLASFIRHVAFALHEPDRADAMDRTLLDRYPDDARLAAEVVRIRVDWGLYERALLFQEAVGDRAAPPDSLLAYAVCTQRRSLDSLLREGKLDTNLAGRLVPVLTMSGRTEDARQALRAADLGSAAEAHTMGATFVAASALLDDAESLRRWLNLWLDAIARVKNGKAAARSLEPCIRIVWNHLPEAERAVLLERIEGLAAGFSGEDRLPLDLLRLHLTEALERPCVDRERVVSDASRDSNVGADVLAHLLDTAAPDERPGLLRNMVASRDPQQARGFLMDVAGSLRVPADDAFVETFLNLFRAAPRERYDPDRALSAVQRGGWNRNPAQPRIGRQIGELLLAEMPTSPPVLVAVATARKTAGAYDEARLLVDEAVESMASAGEFAIAQSRAWDDLATVLTREDCAAIAEELAERAEIEGATPSLLYGQGTLELKAGRWNESAALFEASFRLSPTSRPLGRKVIRLFQDAGRTRDLADLLSALLTRSSIMESFEWRTLTDLYCNLFDPLNAQRAVRRLEGPLSPVENMRVDRMMGRYEQVRATFLRFLITNRNEGRFYNPIWPDGPSTGGMEEYLATQARDWHERPTLFTGIADLPFAEEDCAALLGAAPPDRLDVPGLVDGLARAACARGSQDAWLAALMDAQMRDALNLKDRRLIVALAKEGTQIPPPLAESLDSLPVFMDLGDFRQGRLMDAVVKLYAASGREESARNLLAWLVTADLLAGTTSTQLEDRFDRLEDYLALLPPDERDVERRRWADWLAPTPLDFPGNSYVEALLEFVEQVQPAEERRRKLEATCKALESAVARRDPEAAPWVELARCRAGLGRHDGFVEALSQIVERNDSRSDWITVPLDGRRFLPAASCLDHPERYVRAIVDTVVASRDAGRLSVASATRGLCLLGQWCVDNGLPDEARRILEGLNTSDASPGESVLWHADLARMLGEEEQAIRLETALLQSDRLPVLRVPHLLEVVEAREGQAAAGALAMRVAVYSDHPVVLRRSADAARMQGDQAAAQAFLERLQAVTPAGNP
ncbi:MAG: VWA domain-containing protein [Phycisphaerae bacterium]|nr:VWA domain-containing protein [Phycisphaerae bacterium]